MTLNRRRLATLGLALLPGLLVVGVFFGYPLLRLVRVSFLDDYRNPTDPSTLGNYGELLFNSANLTPLLTSIQLSLAVTILTLLIGYPVAFFLVRSTSRWKAIIFVAIISPLLVSLVVRSLGWLIVLGRDGVLNQVLLASGLTDEPLQLIYTFPAVVVGMAHVLLPFMVLSITSVLHQVPRSLEEAANVLGARRWNRFFRITIPLTLPGVLSGSFLVFALTMGAYVTPQMLGGGRVRVLPLVVYDRMLVVFDWTFGAAAAVTLLAVSLGVAIVIGRIQRRYGVAVGVGS